MSDDREHLREALEAHDLGAIAAAVEASVLPSIRLVSARASDEAIALGVTKLGGAPDLFASTPWPSNAATPLSFLAQIDLDAASRLDPSGALAGKQGLLSFFYDAKNMPWGYPTEGLTGIAVLHHARGGEPLVRRAAEGAKVFLPASVSMFEEETIPRHRTAAARAFSRDPEVLARYHAAMIDFVTTLRRPPRSDGDVHRVLGHPDAIQGDMTRRLEYGLRGKDVDDEDPEIEASARSWRLLLQLDSDRNAKMMWGDLGRLFFWMREDDLRNGRWERVHYQLQC